MTAVSATVFVKKESTTGLIDIVVLYSENILYEYLENNEGYNRLTLGERKKAMIHRETMKKFGLTQCKVTRQLDGPETHRNE